MWVQINYLKITMEEIWALEKKAGINGGEDCTTRDCEVGLCPTKASSLGLAGCVCTLMLASSLGALLCFCVVF